MTFLHLDTSALVKCYIAEDGSDDVIALMADAAAVATSLVTRTEVAAALAKAVREDRVDEDEAQRAHRKFLREWPDFGRVPVTDALVERADALAWEHGLRAYDSVQLAAALACEDIGRRTRSGRATRHLRSPASQGGCPVRTVNVAAVRFPALKRNSVGWPGGSPPGAGS